MLYAIDIDGCMRVGESPFEGADADSAEVAHYHVVCFKNQAQAPHID